MWPFHVMAFLPEPIMSVTSQVYHMPPYIGMHLAVPCDFMAGEFGPMVPAGQSPRSIRPASGSGPEAPAKRPDDAHKLLRLQGRSWRSAPPRGPTRTLRAGRPGVTGRPTPGDREPAGAPPGASRTAVTSCAHA